MFPIRANSATASQLGKVGQGFVSALLVPQYNTADSGQLIPVVLDHWERTGALPTW